MATNFSTRMANLGKTLISKYGLSITITRLVSGTFDPSTQTDSSSSTLSDTCNAIIDDYTAYEIDGEQVRHGDRKVLVYPSSLTNLSYPKVGDNFFIIDSTLRAVNVKGISSGDSFAYYEVRVRK